MPIISLSQLNGPELDSNVHEFDFAPASGHELLLKSGGKRHVWRVVEVYHVERNSGGVGAVAVVSWEGRPGEDSPKIRHLRLVHSSDEIE